jgi:hypothetical protein
MSSQKTVTLKSRAPIGRLYFDRLEVLEQKQVGKYYKHADTVVVNICSVLANQPVAMKYKGPELEGIVLIIGRVCSNFDQSIDQDNRWTNRHGCDLLQFPLGFDVWRKSLCYDQIQSPCNQKEVGLPG